MAKKGVERIGVSLPPDLLGRFDEYIDAKGYKTRSKAIADLVREALTQEEWGDSGEEVMGVLSLVYDHHTRDLAGKLTEIQHEHIHSVISSTHVHMDEHKCLEILILRGPASHVRKLGENLISTRGVLHGKIISTTTGKKL